MEIVINILVNFVPNGILILYKNLIENSRVLLVIITYNPFYVSIHFIVTNSDKLNNYSCFILIIQNLLTKHHNTFSFQLENISISTLFVYKT